MSRMKLLAQVRAAVRVRHFSYRTEQAYVGWVRRFVKFHGTRHPSELGVEEIGQFLSHLATKGGVSASTQNQALAALLFLYRAVIGRELPTIDDIVRARRPKRLPIVLSSMKCGAFSTRWKVSRGWWPACCTDRDYV